jgi:hypothetical protein
MALNPRVHSIPSVRSYSGPNTDDWGRRVVEDVRSLSTMVPQAADKAPVDARYGMIRTPVAPWDPLGGGDRRPVWFNGTTWVAI